MGILAGYNAGAIIGCYVTGKVVNSRQRVGGMVGGVVGAPDGFFGSPAGPGAVIASYSAAEVPLTGGAGRGLLVGTAYRGSISYSYSAGRSYGAGSRDG